MEQFRAIIGFETLYLVGDMGSVASMAKDVPVGRNGGVRKQSAKRLTPSVHPNGHLRVWLSKDGRKRPRLVHRLIAEAFIPNPQGLPLVNHLDGNPANNRVENLEWTTHQGNVIHAVLRGTIIRPSQVGEKNSSAKLTTEDVKAIRLAYAGCGNAAEVARQFNLPPKTAYDICHYRRWIHV